METPFVTRFAPSPTGLLHLGHAYSALLAHRAAQAKGGRFILRIEDIDLTRCKPRYIDTIYQDLTWLGIDWEKPVRRQSAHMEDYAAALNTLRQKNLVYPCFCTRKDIQMAIAQSQSAPHGSYATLYPGTCRAIPQREAQARIISGEAHAWRLDTDAALKETGPLAKWHDLHKSSVACTPSLFGDVILARKDTPTSYHLSVVVDDALQGITHIIRGEDLFDATHIHVLLQTLLTLPIPTYQHHPLLKDDKGVRYAKRNTSVTLASLRDQGMSSDDICALIGL